MYFHNFFSKVKKFRLQKLQQNAKINRKNSKNRKTDFFGKKFPYASQRTGTHIHFCSVCK